MEAKANIIEPLLERAEEYTKTSFELLKLKSLDKTADIAATALSRLVTIVVLFVFVMTLNIALALWLGEVLGKNYYGFLVVALIYGVIALILSIVHPSVKRWVNNSIITLMLS